MCEDEFGLRPIWDEVLTIYNVVADICNRHGLRYYVSDGTLIGAIRNGGFIPWDDDFDISMPRPDYERFIKIAKTELPVNLKFVNWKNTPEFHLMFGKVQECRKEYVLDVEREAGVQLSNGLFIDVFPIDGYPHSAFARKIIRLLDFILRQDMAYRFEAHPKPSLKRRVLRAFGACIAVLTPWLCTYSDFLKIYENILLSFPFEKEKYTGRASVVRHVLRKAPLASSAWGNGKLHEFDKIKVRVPDDADAYLKSVYGDYMKLPPPEKRHPTHDYGSRCPWWLGPTKG